jgi:glycosyltransferase involved in cell wall biosynthesis
MKTDSITAPVRAAVRSPAQRPRRVLWTGLRGFPGVQGGVETHAEQLCPRLHALGVDVTVLARQCYQLEETGPTWRGVHFVGLWTPRRKQLEAIVHTLLSVLYAGFVSRPDVLHIQAIGPAIWTPLARLLGLHVVVTHHGADYERQKWGRLAKFVLRLGEACAARFASELIVISRGIQRSVALKYGRVGVLVPNGIAPPQSVPDSDALRPFGLEPGRYIALVSRLVPEKRHLDLIEAFRRAGLVGWKLALVGGADHADDYSRQVVEVAAATPGVVMTGFQSGAALQALFAHAGLFVLPSSHEGLPIAMLEALSYGTPVVASDIPANLEVGLPRSCHFPLGDVDALAALLRAHCGVVESPAQREARRDEAVHRFDWARNARATRAIYDELCGVEPEVGTAPDWPVPTFMLRW